MVVGADLYNIAETRTPEKGAGGALCLGWKIVRELAAGPPS